MAKIIDINEENMDEYKLFCKKSQSKEKGYQNKAKWITERFKEGLKYKLLLVKESKGLTSRGFIEYIPGEYNWRGVQADGWMVIHCLWVVGKHKKQGYGSQLLEECFKDAKGQGLFGVVIMTAEKGGWLPKKALFLKHGFKKVDDITPNYVLYAKAFTDDPPLPKFYPLSDEVLKEYNDGITIFNSHQCPYVYNIVEELKEYAHSKNISFQEKVLKDCKEAQQNSINAYGTYCIICNGEFVSYKARKMKETLNLIINSK